MKPYLLDLFCAAGGASKGYADAGFEVVGVDIHPQPNYPFEFIQADALHFVESQGHELSPRSFEVGEPSSFAAIHASPPCQGYSPLTSVLGDQADHPDLIAATRDLLRATGLPYVIENVEGAVPHLREPTMLCGSAFGLPLRRHRYFETTFPLMSPGCAHGRLERRFDVFEHGKWHRRVAPAIYGTGGGKAVEHWPEALGIDWMTRDEMAEAIPPAYTAHIGEYLMREVEARRAVAV